MAAAVVVPGFPDGFLLLCSVRVPTARVAFTIRVASAISTSVVPPLGPVNPEAPNFRLTFMYIDCELRRAIRRHELANNKALGLGRPCTCNTGGLRQAFGLECAIGGGEWRGLLLKVEPPLEPLSVHILGFWQADICNTRARFMSAKRAWWST